MEKISTSAFDACFITTSELKTDARTLNLARTLVKHGKKIAIIGIGFPSEVIDFSLENITFFFITKSDSKRAWRRSLKFTFAARKYRMVACAKTYWAEDLFSLFVSKELARIHKGKLIYDSREIYSALGPLYKSPIKQRLLTSYEKKYIKYLSNIIVSGPLDAEYLKKHFKSEIPYHVIMNLPPYREPVESNIIREKYSIPNNSILLLYQGMLLEGRGLIPIITSLPYIDNVYFCLLGGGPFREKIIDTAKKIKVENRVILCGKVSYDELHKFTSSADIGTTFIEPISLSYKYALPNKLFEYCMAGIPTLASDLPAMRNVIEKYKIGELLPHTATPRQIAESIKEIHSKRNEYKSSCLEAAKTFSYESQENVILSLIGN